MLLAKRCKESSYGLVPLFEDMTELQTGSARDFNRGGNTHRVPEALVLMSVFVIWAGGPLCCGVPLCELVVPQHQPTVLRERREQDRKRVLRCDGVHRQVSPSDGSLGECQADVTVSASRWPPSTGRHPERAHEPVGLRVHLQPVQLLRVRLAPKPKPCVDVVHPERPAWRTCRPNQPGHDAAQTG